MRAQLAYVLMALAATGVVLAVIGLVALISNHR
jgi:hypothetical protein